MRIAVLGATGRVGGLVVDQALERGHDVVALARTPEKMTRPRSARLEVRQADVASAAFPDLADVDVVISAIGIAKGDGPGALTAGAKALSASGIRTVWLGALGSGRSRGAGGWLYSVLMRLFVGKELAEKAEADDIALAAGATVFHAPDLGNGAIGAGRRTVRLAEFRTPVLPLRISRATAAALLLDEAEAHAHGAEIVVPLA